VILDPIVSGQAPRVVGRPRHSRVPTVEDQACRSVRIRRGKERRECGTVPPAEEHRPIAFGGIHHGTDVVHPRFEVGHSADPIRQAGSSLVEDENAKTFREAAHHVGEARLLPIDLEVRHPRLDDDEIGSAALADSLVGDPHVVGRFRVEGLRDHGSSLGWGDSTGNRKRAISSRPKLPGQRRLRTGRPLRAHDDGPTMHVRESSPAAGWAEAKTWKFSSDQG
jgi:hypothetical protein